MEDEFIPDSQEGSFNLSLHLKQFCNNKQPNSADTNTSSHELTQPLVVSTPFGGNYVPDLSSIQTHSFSCFSLSGESNNNNNDRPPAFDITAHMPSQIRPTSPTAQLMPPPPAPPIQQSQEDYFAIPLSIPNHYDDNGNFVSLSGVLSSRRRQSSNAVTIPAVVDKTPKLPRKESTIQFDTISDFETPTLPGVKGNKQTQMEREEREDECEEGGNDPETSIYVEDSFQFSFDMSGQLPGPNPTSPVINHFDSTITEEVEDEIEEDFSRVPESPLVQPKVSPVVEEAPKPVENETPVLPTVVETKSPIGSENDMEKLKKHLRKVTPGRANTVKFVSFPTDVHSTTTSAEKPVKEEPQLKQETLTPCRRISHDDTQDTLLFQPNSMDANIMTLAAEYEVRSKASAIKKSMDVMKEENSEKEKASPNAIQNDNDGARHEEMKEALETPMPENEEPNESPLQETSSASVLNNESIQIEESILTIRAKEGKLPMHPNRKRQTPIAAIEEEPEETSSCGQDDLISHQTVIDPTSSQDLMSASFPLPQESGAGIQATPSQSQRVLSLAPGDRVWAQKEDKYFYAATIMTIFCQGVFGLAFEDNTTDHTPSSKIRKIELEPGDPVEVLFGKSFVNAVLHARHDDKERYFLTIEMKRRKKLIGPMGMEQLRLSVDDVEFQEEKEQIKPSSVMKPPQPQVTPANQIVAAANPMTMLSDEEEEVVVKPASTKRNAKRVLMDTQESQENDAQYQSKRPKPLSLVDKNKRILTKTRPRKKPPVKEEETVFKKPKMAVDVNTLSLSAKKVKLFSKYQFILTCMEGEENKRRKKKDANDSEQIKAMIIEYGGDVIELEDLEKNKRIKETVLISSKPSRTTKYFMALAKRIQRVHVSWVRDCIDNLGVLDTKDYLLPNGLNDNEEILYCNHPNILQGKVIYISATKVSSEEKGYWQKMVVASDGQVSYKQNDAKIDYFVTLTDEVPKTAHHASKYVSKEWLCQCLIQQKLLHFSPYLIEGRSAPKRRNK